MTFALITHVTHIVENKQYFAYAPYVREMNIWTKYCDKLLLVAPNSMLERSKIDIEYQHQDIHYLPIASFDILSPTGIAKTIIKIPKISWQIFKAMQQADHIHLRCPGNVGLLAAVIQLFFPNKTKTAKYAGNWDPNSKQPLTYRLQKWILSNTFLTKNIQVLVYGQWTGSSKNIKPFFTATYFESEKQSLLNKNLEIPIKCVFVGTLVSGKRPLYAIQLVEGIQKKGYNIELELYGEGIERATLEEYIKHNQLAHFIFLKGNQTQETVKAAYCDSHFVILPSQSEGWPKAIAEAMFWGCVPVASAVSCVPFMLDYGERGLVLQMQIENDISQMISVLENEDRFEQLSLNAKKWSEQYTLDLFEAEIKKLM